jgi:putative transposase
MDFVSDSLANGRRIKCLTVADDFSHECVDIAVDYGISGQYVTRLLDQHRMNSCAAAKTNHPVLE